jgi:hypothetical protein
MAASECDLQVWIDDHGTLTLLTNAWVYVREGGTLTVGRADAQGDIWGFGGSGDKTRPDKYTGSFRSHLDAQVDAFFSKGAKPIPDAQVTPSLRSTKVELLSPANSGSFFSCSVGPGVGVNSIRRVAVGRIKLPQVIIGVTKPVELSLWLALFEPLDERAPPPRGASPAPAPDAYYTEGISQGQSWFAQANASTLEDTASAAPSDAVRPRTRGLRIEGFIDAAATGATLRLLRGDTVVNLFRDGWDPGHSPRVTEIAATLQAASGDRKAFSATVFLANAPAGSGPTQDVVSALGPIQIVVLSSGGMTPPIVGGFASQLVGAQVGLIDDYRAGPAGTAAGPVPSESDEVQIVDYLVSPSTVSSNDEKDHARTRRMVPYDIKAERAADFALPALAARITPAPQPALSAKVVQVVSPEMPMWMAELELVGLSGEDLEDLLVRRVTSVPAGTGQIHIELDWHLAIEWLGPDKDAAGAVQLPAFDIVERQTFEIKLDGNKEPTQKKLAGIDPSTGQIAGALTPTPSQVGLPVTPRRLPTLTLFRNGSGPTRSWGRHPGSSIASTILEWQPAFANAGQAVIRGGDGRLALTKLSIDGAPVDVGVVFPRPKTPAPADAHNPRPAAPDAPFGYVPRFRVRGLNPTPAALDTIVDAVVEHVFRSHAATSAWLDFLPLTLWQQTARLLLSHESGKQQFAKHSFVGVQRFGANVWYGKEKNMPVFGPPHGYGLGQIDPPGNPEQVWSFLENLREAAKRFMVDKGHLAMTTLGGHGQFAQLHPVLSRRSKAVFHRQCVRLYNGGTEFRWDAAHSDWVIHPSVLTEPNIYYPDNVLQGQLVGSRVPYQDLLAHPTTPGRLRTPPGGPPLAFIAFLPAHYPQGI